MPPDFNWQSYLNANPDVSKALGYSENAAISHYLNHGQYENRPLKFDWKSYLNANPDVSTALGYSEDAATRHYREYGYKEGRQLSIPAAPSTPSTPTRKPLSVEYGQSPTIFGGLDYTEATKNGYSDSEIKNWLQSTNTPFAAETGSYLGLSSTTPTTPTKQTYSLNEKDTALYDNYVKKYPDLFEAWSNPATNVQKNYSSISDWGYYHYNFGRTDPTKDVRTLEDPVTKEPIQPPLATRDLSTLITNIYSVYKDKPPTVEELKYWTDKANTDQLTDDQLLKSIHPVTTIVPVDASKVEEKTGELSALIYNAANKTWVRTKGRTDNPIYTPEEMLPTNQAKDYWDGFAIPISYGYTPTQTDYQTFANYGKSDEANKKTNANRTASNANLEAINAENKKINDLNTKKNLIHNEVIVTANGARRGEYLTQKNALAKTLGTLDETERKDLVDSYRQFYVTERLDKWDSTLSVKPPYGDFDPKYYKEQNPDVKQNWDNYVKNDDVDVVERYGETGFYINHYTNFGKKEKRRANAAEIAEEAKKYTEAKKTDAEIQAIRDQQLGLNTDTQASRLMGEGSAIAAEWDKAKKGDPYWSKQAKEKYLDIDKQDEFLTLFRLSERPEDKEILKGVVGTKSGITELEDAFNQAVGAEALVETKKFGALAQDVLKQTIAEMKKAKGQEQMLGLYKGLGGFSEIMDINKQLSDSILGDSGVGGILSHMGSTTETEEDLEKKLENITGVRNNVVYNWQKWFDTTLKERYQKDIELGYKTEDSEEQLKIDGAFAKKFVDGYLTPRFNTSRSMDEFREYIDVRQEEQNPFQTQDIVNAVKVVADRRIKDYLDKIQNTAARNFDSEFYFNPTGDKAREEDYKKQMAVVAGDWENAKKGDLYWAQQAYRFGIDVNDKDAFARIHFQVKGQGRGYDGADDIVNASKIQDEIYKNILPALSKEAKDLGSVFGIFTTPEEFADDVLEGVDPTDKEAWDKVLKANGLEDFKGTIDELKEEIKEALRTGSAQTIRENIKYLNEKRERPTQEKLGILYIERPEDYKTGVPKSDTALYTTFQKAGYKGTEDEFYEKFFPDTDRSEQEYLTKALTGADFKITGLTTSNDPFENFNTIQGMFPEEEEDKKKDDDKIKPPSQFFRLGLEDDEEDEDYDYKSKSGSDILGEFTKNFK